ncbi:MAG: ethanolamine ammonia-lyase subunit EutC [Kineosporiaceae bacterium]
MSVATGEELERGPVAAAGELVRGRADDVLRARMRELTPARVLLGRAGTSYPTAEVLRLRADHAAARDAVRTPLVLGEGPLGELAARLDLLEVSTCAGSKAEYLRRPDLGRRLSEDAVAALADHPRGADVQVVVGDGLSSTAVAAQVPVLLPALLDAVRARGWSLGRPFVVRHCRVGVMNDVGALLDPAVVVLLVGERPGLATSESLSAYLGHRPRPGHTDADRVLLSNIHDDGVPAARAAEPVVALIERLKG